MQQDALTVITRIKQGQAPALKAYLAPIGADILNRKGRTEKILDFEDLEMVHFMRWVVLDESADPELSGNLIPAQLAMETNFDGPLDQHLDRLVQVGGRTLREIYEHCEGFPPAPGQAAPDIKTYLLDHRFPTPAFYIGTHGLSVAQIKEDQNLRDRIEGFLDLERRSPGWLSKPAAAMRADILRFVAGVPELQGVLASNPPPSPLPGWVWIAGLVGALLFPLLATAGGLMRFGVPWGAALGIFFGIPLGCFLVLVIILLAHEGTDDVTPVSEDHQWTKLVAFNEDNQIQNQMTDVVFIKSGVFRQFLLKTVFAGIQWAANHVFNRGELGGIPSIHFARWVIIDQGRRLLFFSNFDGSWESYLDDFIDKAAHGLTAVWSNAWRFPRAWFLLFGGAQDEQDFKTYVRASQLPTQVWYSAYPELSVQNINTNARIRAMLSGKPRAKEIDACLKRL